MIKSNTTPGQHKPVHLHTSLIHSALHLKGLYLRHQLCRTLVVCGGFSMFVEVLKKNTGK